MNNLNIIPRRLIYLLTLLTFVSRLSLAFRDEPQIFSFPYVDDAFYVFGYSSHFIHGEGFTVDGITPSNGVHPLIVALYAPLYVFSVGNKINAIRYSFAITALLDSFCVLGIAVLASALKRRGRSEMASSWICPPLIAAFIWTTSESVFVNTANGLETALYSLLIISSLIVYVDIWKHRKEYGKEPNNAQWTVLGILLGLMVLARIDGIFLVGSFLAYEIYHFEKGNLLVRGLSLSILPLFISSPWWIYNYILFGSFFPISGQSESLTLHVGENLHFAIIALSNIMVTCIRLPYWGTPIFVHVIWVISLFLLLVMLQMRLNIFPRMWARLYHEALIPLLAAGACLALYYVFFFSAPYFIDRYFQPIRLLWILILSVGIKLISTRTNILLRRQYYITKILALLMLIGVIGFNSYKFTKYFSAANTCTLYLAGKWAANHPNDKIGMIQSGIASYISGNIINLDGKVNYSALNARKKKHLTEYLQSESISYVADWPKCIHDYLEPEFTDDGIFILVDSIISRRKVFPNIQIYEKRPSLSFAKKEITEKK